MQGSADAAGLVGGEREGALRHAVDKILLVPAVFHQARCGMGVGTEQQMAKFMCDHERGQHVGPNLPLPRDGPHVVIEHARGWYA